MSKKSLSFRGFLQKLPQKYGEELRAKEALRALLEEEERLTLPSRIWAAFLLPSDMDHVPPLWKSVSKLKKETLKELGHPAHFLTTHDPLHHTSNHVTLALLELLYDLSRKKSSISEKKYGEWLEVADRFGLWQLRYALEDIIFKTFDPENFSLFQSVVEKKMFMEQHIVLAIRGIVEDALKRDGFKKFAIKNRRKNIYGVYQKTIHKKININEIYDIHGFRILVPAKKDCAKALEVLHRLWPHLPERYKDYIANPKPNGYRSLHTVLRCLEGKLIEFQIRTYEMDYIAASGPANHADYKKSRTTRN